MKDSYNIDAIKIVEVDKDGYCHTDIDSTVYEAPVVYILNDSKHLYVGETINVRNRFSNHNTNSIKKKLLNRHIIYSKYFNKSVILHLEAFLISHFSADSHFTMVNGNLGNNSHYYYKKKKYEEVFPKLWKELQNLKLAHKSIEEIHNSDLFKYSPYKSLFLEQQRAVLSTLRALANTDKKVIIEGGAGTGKTILAIYLIKLLTTPLSLFENYEIDDSFTQEVYELLSIIHKKKKITSKNIALVVSMASLRETLQEVFKNTTGLKKKMVISPTELTKKKYELILVDEAHRLKRRKNIVNYFSFDNCNRRLGFDIKEGTELDWILAQSNQQIFFYDKGQSIKPSDIPVEKFDSVRINAKTIFLRTQIRSKGGNLFTTFINELLNCSLEQDEFFETDTFDLFLFDDMNLMRGKILEKDKQYGLARLVAGYAWKWYSKGDKTGELYDMKIDGVKLRWNSTYINFINSENAVNEVGCIHTTQGYDINYVGVIFGPEIGYSKAKKCIEIYPEKYEDKNGKNTATEEELYDFILNIYRTLLLRGIKGVYIYCCNKQLFEYFSQHIKLYREFFA